MKSMLKSALLFCLVFIYCACKKSEKPGEENLGNASGVYVAYSAGAQHNSRDALLWHDGTTTVLNDTFTGVYLRDVAVANSEDVYTTGCECWKSSSPYQINLTDSCFLL